MSLQLETNPGRPAPWAFVLSPALTAGLLALAAPAALAEPQCPPDAFEPNESCFQPPLIGAGTLAGLTLAPGDLDFFAADVPAGQRIEVRVQFQNPGPSLGGLLGLFRDDGSALPCDDSSNEVAVIWFAAGQPNPLLLSWSTPNNAAERFIVELGNFSTECGIYDLDIAIVPDPCASLPPDGFEGNDDCASAMVLGTGTFLGLNVGIHDPDFYAVTAGPGELVTVSVSGLAAGEQATLYGWEQGQTCPSPVNFASVGLVFAQSTGGVYLFNPGPGAKTFIVQLVPTPNQATQSGFCLQYSLSVSVEFNPCDMLAGDPFEPNSDCANPPVLAGSQTGLKISAWSEQDWYTIDVPAHSTLRLMSTSTSSLKPRPMMLFSGCLSSPQDFLASSNNLLFNSSDPRHWLQWSNTSDFPVSTRLFMLNNAMLFPNAFCDIYDLAFELTLGKPYCIPTANSTGGAARLSASGSTTVGQGTLALVAAPVPANTLGLVFMGPGQKAPTPFGDGWLCTQSPLLRLPVAPTGAGALHTTIDWTGTTAVISAGQSWSFQAWFRDPTTLKAFNVSEGLELAFQ